MRRAAEALRAAASLPPSHLLAVRGNHDTFGVAERGGAHDMFGAWRSGEGVTEARATRLLVGRGTADSPHVSLLQLDASRIGELMPYLHVLWSAFLQSVGYLASASIPIPPGTTSDPN